MQKTHKSAKGILVFPKFKEIYIYIYSYSSCDHVSPPNYVNY